MPKMSDTISVAANSTSPNVLAGLQHGTIQFRRAGVRVAATTTAVGVKVLFLLGERQVLNFARVPASNREPDFTTGDLLSTVPARLYQPMFLQFQNTTAGALVVTWSVDVEPG